MQHGCALAISFRDHESVGRERWIYEDYMYDGLGRMVTTDYPDPGNYQPNTTGSYAADEFDH